MHFGGLLRNVIVLNYISFQLLPQIFQNFIQAMILPLSMYFKFIPIQFRTVLAKEL